MANFSRFFVFFAIFLVPSVLATTDHIVGGDQGWNTGVDFSSWAIRQTFFVGDNLVFKYARGAHNVIEVDVSGFAQCASPAGKRPLETGNDVIPLLTPGTKWFICTLAKGKHCQSGQALVITVLNPPADVGQPSFPPLSLPPVIVPALPLPSSPPPIVAAPVPSVPSPVPTPSGNIIPPSQSPLPSPTAPPPSGAAGKAAVSGHLRFLAVAVGVLAGIMI